MTFDHLGRHKSISNFKVVRGLGRGAFGQVFMVRDTTESNITSIIRQMLRNENHFERDNQLC